MVHLTQAHIRTTGIGHFAEVTALVQGAVERSGVREGVALVRSRHTTAAIACNEPDPRLHEDMRDAVYRTFPRSSAYRHIEEGAENAIAHLATSMLFGESTWAPVRGGHLDLGTWQHIYLVELYEPRRRTIDIAIMGE